jgi:tetratricopeptide (TPR) repeat protein
MRASSAKTHLLPAAIVVAGFVAVVWLSVWIGNTRPSLPDDYADSDLTMNGSRFRGFTLGMDGLVADWYYIRAIEYVGNKILNSRSELINIDDLRDLNPRLLYPLLDNATDLDPHYIDAYLYGAIVMPAIDPQKAIAIAEKGVANNPNQWKLYGPLGYIYWKLGDYEKASAIYEKGSQIEGAPPFMKMMAAAMKTSGGSRATAREIYREMLNSSDENSVRITAQRRLQQLDSLDEREAIDQVLTEFKETNGRCASSFAEIMPKLMTVKLPENHEFHVDRWGNLADPTGVSYLLDKDNCRAELDTSRSGIIVTQ